MKFQIPKIPLRALMLLVIVCLLLTFNPFIHTPKIVKPDSEIAAISISSKKKIILLNPNNILGQPKSLILFSYAERDEVSIRNLDYFINVGISDTGSADFIIIVTGFHCKPCAKWDLKLRLSNVFIHYRKTPGDDFSSYGETLELIDRSQYAYFVFLNRHVRGPITTLYEIDNLKNWFTFYTSLFNDQIKLVGSTISCQLAIHVQTHAFAVDSIALDITLKGNIFRMERESTLRTRAIKDLELTRIIIQKGYSIKSLQLQYALINWKKEFINRPDNGVGFCNKGLDPTVVKSYGSGDFGPQYSIPHYEVIFYKRSGLTHSVCRKGKGKEEVCDFDAWVDDSSIWIENIIWKQKIIENRSH